MTSRHHRARAERAGRRRRAPLRTMLSTLGVVALAGASLVGASSAALASPGTPGVVQPGTVLFSEGFENVAGTDPVLLTDYVGATGQQYTADPAWLVSCNGGIVNFSIPYTNAGNCTPDSAARLRQLAYALGVHAGAADPQANNVVAAYTDNNPGADKVEIETVAPITLSGAGGRFLAFSVDAAALNCFASSPIYQFSVVDGGGTATNVGGQLTVCSSASTVDAPVVGPAPAQAVSVGTYTSNGAFLFSGSTLGIRMTNANGSGGGNDAAFDNLRILDVTPQLDKSFAPARLVTGETATLTLTITNTEELAAKNGWSFTDALPAGLTVGAGTPTTTCAAGTVTAAPGATSVVVSGDLSAGSASCTVSVPVTSQSTGTYANGPANITGVGVNAPGTAVVEFVDPAPAISLVKSASPSPDEEFSAGQQITYSFLVTNTGNVPLTDVRVDEGEFSGSGALSAVTCPAAAEELAPTASVTCTATYTATAADVAAGSISNAATATGTPTAGDAPVSEISEVTIPSVPVPAIAIDKSASPANVSAAGQTVTYSFLITNTGNVALADVTAVEGEFSGTGDLSAVTCPAGAALLAPTASVTCTATYVATQADVDAGEITNTATATGDPLDPDVPSPVSEPDEAVVGVETSPSLALVKTASADRATTVGQVITYSFAITNTGNVTLRDVTVQEGAFSGTGTLSDVVCPTAAARMAPGAQVTCTASYVVTRADLDAGSITNAATARGLTPDGGMVSSGPGVAKVTSSAPALATTGGADLRPAAVAAAAALLIGGALLLRRRIGARRV